MTGAPTARIGRAALLALREELEVSPKPGLVSPADRGAHDDMDAATFLASLRALRGTFGAAARAGLERAAARELRAIGLRAEARMLAATGGVNTHRGAIFTLGLLSAAAGRLAGAGEPPRAGPLRAAASRLARGLDPVLAGGTSHGALVARRHGAGGARAEALAGFPHLFEVALPALRRSLARGAPRRDAAVQCLLATVAELPDTNLLYRAGPPGLAFARREARRFLDGGGVHRPGWEDAARALHAEFVARRLSPGGSADLLAAALLVARLERAAAATQPQGVPAGAA